MNTNKDQTEILPEAPYRVRHLTAKGLGSRQFLYSEINSGRLRAARLNGRGDLVVLGRWALDYLEAKAER